MLGSSRESAELWLYDGFPPATKLLIVWLRRYSSTTFCRFLYLRKKMTPPMMAPIATTPTTTPAAIPALLGPDGAGLLLGVMMIVCPPSVIVA